MSNDTNPTTVEDDLAAQQARTDKLYDLLLKVMLAFPEEDRVSSMIAEVEAQRRVLDDCRSMLEKHK